MWLQYKYKVWAKDKNTEYPYNCKASDYWSDQATSRFKIKVLDCSNSYTILTLRTKSWHDTWVGKRWRTLERRTQQTYIIKNLIITYYNYLLIICVGQSDNGCALTDGLGLTDGMAHRLALTDGMTVLFCLWAGSNSILSSSHSHASAMLNIDLKMMERIELEPAQRQNSTRW